ncbi:hypothetical protein Bca101_046156 [Brassica carinata]
MKAHPQFLNDWQAKLWSRFFYFQICRIGNYVENPEFKRKLDRMVVINNEKLMAVGQTDDPSFVKNLKRIPLIAGLVSEILAAYLMPLVESGSVDFAEFEPNLVY